MAAKDAPEIVTRVGGKDDVTQRCPACDTLTRRLYGEILRGGGFTGWRPACRKAHYLEHYGAAED